MLVHLLLLGRQSGQAYFYVTRRCDDDTFGIKR